MAMRFAITGGDAFAVRANLFGATPGLRSVKPPSKVGIPFNPSVSLLFSRCSACGSAAGTQQARSALASLSFTHGQGFLRGPTIWVGTAALGKGGCEGNLIYRSRPVTGCHMTGPTV